MIISRQRGKRVVEVHPRNSELIWSITFPSVASAKRHEGILRKFPQEKLWEMYVETIKKKEQKKMTKKRIWELLTWQRDPLKLTADKVQFWQNGIFMGVVDLEEARQLVAGNQAYVLTAQAIAAYKK